MSQAAEGGDEKGPSKEITDIAEAALSFQPKGNTLSTTQVRNETIIHTVTLPVLCDLV